MNAKGGYLLDDSRVSSLRKIWFIMLASSVSIALFAILFRPHEMAGSLSDFFKWYMIFVSVFFLMFSVMIHRTATLLNQRKIAPLERTGQPIKDPEQRVFLLNMIALLGVQGIAIAGFVIQWRTTGPGAGLPFFFANLLGIIWLYPSEKKMKP